MGNRFHAAGGRRAALILAMTLIIAALATSGWLILPRVQVSRADSMLSDANSHIESANMSLGGIDTGLLEIEGFTSLESIEQAAARLADAEPLLAASEGDISYAGSRARAAAGLAGLPSSDREYLEKKTRISELRQEQQDLLLEAAGKLDSLYTVAPLVFQSMDEMDRLFGQFQQALGEMRSQPQETAQKLDGLASSMQAIQQQLDNGYQGSGFEILKDFAANAGDYAALATAAANLASAIASGGQEQTQEAANNLESRLFSTRVGVDYIGLWLEQEIDPLRDSYRELQERQQLLDREAAEIYQNKE